MSFLFGIFNNSKEVQLDSNLVTHPIYLNK